MRRRRAHVPATDPDRDLEEGLDRGLPSHRHRGLDLDLRVRLGGFDLQCRLQVGPGEVVAVVGPNGAGKSTLLQAIAGLVDVEGRVEAAGRVLDDSGAGVHVPAAARRIGVVFQDHLLFPHLTARGNVAFGPRARGIGRDHAHQLADQWLARIGLAAHAGARVAQLSGGQAQRVALARALASEPTALLLDEPLAALDVATRHATRRLLRQHLDAFPGPVVLVTHDPVEAGTLAERIVVLEAGRVTHDGDVAGITGHPRTPWAARLAGVNLYAGTARGTEVVLDDRHGTLATADALHGPVWVTVPPAAVALYRDPPHGTPRNVWPVTVRGHETVGDRVRVQLDGAPPVTAEVTPTGAASLDLAGPGDLWASVKATELTVYPR